MSKRERAIRNAIGSKGGVYKSKETREIWIVEKVKKCGKDCRNYKIKHQHPERNLHDHAYAESVESAIKKILKHEEWTLSRK